MRGGKNSRCRFTGKAKECGYKGLQYNAVVKSNFGAITLYLKLGFNIKGNPGEKMEFSGIQVVFTKENQTGDAYMEALVAQIGPNYNVRVATSDALVQLSSIRSGVLRVSARELQEEVVQAQKEMRQHFQKA